jgi:UDP-N-acetyl-D-glucosamine dehydrogenase
MEKNRINLLKKKIQNKEAIIGVVGLGYVGLPLAITFARKGFNVIGIDISEGRVNSINKGVSYISDVTNDELKKIMKGRKLKVTTNFSAVKKLDTVIICVPTPLRKNKKPDMSYIKKAVGKIKNNIQKGQIIVLESTTYPGTTREILLPVLESTGLKEGKDFYLAFSPERIDPGNKIYKTENTPKVIGGISPQSTDIATFLYSKVIKKVVPVSSADAAEMVKLLENTFRIVNIALVNEITTLCDKFNFDIWEIIDAAKTKPYGFMPFYPGPGCGGHCIPIDPLYLSWKAKEHGFKTKFIDLASHVNEHMPSYVVGKTEKILSESGKGLNNANVLIIGVAYKKDVKDLRESPAIEVIKILKKKKANVSYYDPYFPYFKINGIDMKPISLNKKTLKTFDIAILLADHSNMDYKFFTEHLKQILDTRNIFFKLGIKSENIHKL